MRKGKISAADIPGEVNPWVIGPCTHGRVGNKFFAVEMLQKAGRCGAETWSESSHGTKQTAVLEIETSTTF